MKRPPPISSSGELKPALQQFRMLNFYQKKIDEQLKLLEEVKTCLPPHLVEHCKHCLINEQNVLVIFTDAQVWLSQLRFCQAAILQKLAQTGVVVAQLQVKLLMPAQAPKPQAAIMPSDETVRVLQQYGDSEDELGQALARLGRTLERLKNKD